MILLDGSEIDITPMKDGPNKYFLGTGITNKFAVYDSYDKLMYLAV